MHKMYICICIFGLEKAGVPVGRRGYAAVRSSGCVHAVAHTVDASRGCQCGPKSGRVRALGGGNQWIEGTRGCLRRGSTAHSGLERSRQRFANWPEGSDVRGKRRSPSHCWSQSTRLASFLFPFPYPARRNPRCLSLSLSLCSSLSTPGGRDIPTMLR